MTIAPVNTRALLRATAWLVVALLLAAALGYWLAVRAAWAHGPDTEWLMDGQFRNMLGEHCCSPGRDCQPIPAGDVERLKNGWLYKPTGEVVPDGNVHRSRDPQDRYWRCEGTRYWGLDGRSAPTKTRCLFIGGTS